MSRHDRHLPRETLEAIAEKVGTPFYFYDAAEIRTRIGDVKKLTDAPGIQGRYAMKACSARRVLEEMRTQDIWIDAVSGNEILRALRAGFASGFDPPVLLYTSDVFRDNALDVCLEHRILVNVGTPQMVEQLSGTGYDHPIGIRLNPGFGHGHSQQCDTGGPSSKHGIWYEDADAVLDVARKNDLEVALLHAHIGTGSEVEVFEADIRRLVDFFLERVDRLPNVSVVSFGGGIPYPYRPGEPLLDLQACGQVLREARTRLSERTGRDIRVEVEPGRYFVASGASLVARVRGLKTTKTNPKGPGHRFVLVDAGFCDLVRPAMYGAYHHIDVIGKEDEKETEPQVVAGPMCESGDVFTRDSDDLLDPRSLPRAEIGDLVAIRDAGAYGVTMSSNYNSLGRVPQIWYDDGKTFLMSRRESVEDLLRTECWEELG